MDQFYAQEVGSIRRVEYPALKDVTYLDHAGTTLYPESSITSFSTDMRTNLFGNPHSASPSSELSTARTERVRLRILQFFKADPAHFDVVFTANATAAIKMVIDTFRDADSHGFWYGYHRDAHTSLVGPRQIAAQARCFESDNDVEDWLDEGDEGDEAPRPNGSLRAETPGTNGSHYEETPRANGSSRGVGLFAYPAQSNMNGHRLPMDWAGRIRRSSHMKHRKIYTLVDAAAYVMTAQLDLTDVDAAPDFVALSFYKIFGFPDLGALIVRKSAHSLLQQRKYFGGGTVDMITVIKSEWVAKKCQTIHEQLEDGTLAFHSIIALDSALNVHRELFGSMAQVSKHTCALAVELFRQMKALRHANGQHVCEIYKDPNSQYGNVKTQGPTLAFNLRNAQGGWIGKSDVEKLAIAQGIHLRTGGVCNPGGIATFCELEYWELRRNFSEGMRCGDDIDILGGKPTGIVRVSLGAMSSMDDVVRLISFIEEIFVETSLDPAGLALSAHPVGGAADCSIESIRVFPVAGCGSWQVPQHTSWPVSATSLAWDREWCVVPQGDGAPFTADSHPHMRLIRPYLNLKRGTLRLVAATSVSSDADEPPDDFNELTISLWDSPPSTHKPLTSGHLPADRYVSSEIASFFTTVLGTPCTLARFQDYRRVAKTQHVDPSVLASPTSPHRPALDRAVTIALATSPIASTANVVLTPPSQSQPISRYVRLGAYHFEVFGEATPSMPLESPTLTRSTSLRSGPPKHRNDLQIARPSASAASLQHSTPQPHDYQLHLLPSPDDRSLTMQNPALQPGSPVALFPTPMDVASSAPLRACIAAGMSPSYRCPVWFCRQAFSTTLLLDDHIREAHSSTASPIVAEIHGRDATTLEAPDVMAAAEANATADVANGIPDAVEAAMLRRVRAHKRSMRVLDDDFQVVAIEVDVPAAPATKASVEHHGFEAALHTSTHERTASNSATPKTPPMVTEVLGRKAGSRANGTQGTLVPGAAMEKGQRRKSWRPSVGLRASIRSVMAS